MLEDEKLPSVAGGKEGEETEAPERTPPKISSTKKGCQFKIWMLLAGIGVAALSLKVGLVVDKWNRLREPRRITREYIGDGHNEIKDIRAVARLLREERLRLEDLPADPNELMSILADSHAQVLNYGTPEMENEFAKSLKEFQKDVELLKLASRNPLLAEGDGGSMFRNAVYEKAQIYLEKECEKIQNNLDALHENESSKEEIGVNLWPLLRYEHALSNMEFALPDRFAQYDEKITYDEKVTLAVTEIRRESRALSERIRQYVTDGKFDNDYALFCLERNIHYHERLLPGEPLDEDIFLGEDDRNHFRYEYALRKTKMSAKIMVRLLGYEEFDAVLLRRFDEDYSETISLKKTPFDKIGITEEQVLQFRYGSLQKELRDKTAYLNAYVEKLSKGNSIAVDRETIEATEAITKILDALEKTKGTMKEEDDEPVIPQEKFTEQLLPHYISVATSIAEKIRERSTDNFRAHDPQDDIGMFRTLIDQMNRYSDGEYSTEDFNLSDGDIAKYGIDRSKILFRDVDPPDWGDLTTGSVFDMARRFEPRGYGQRSYNISEMDTIVRMLEQKRPK